MGINRTSMPSLVPAHTETKKVNPKDFAPKYAVKIPMGTAKLIITEKIQKQIDFLHRSVGPTEWSGILLYTIEGNFRDVPNLVFTAQELFFMDIGSSTYTEYEGSPEIVDMWDNIADMDNYRIGHIHSHHNMATFFSGTDLSELDDNAHNHVVYLSLIVNFAKIYSAKAAIYAKRAKASTVQTAFKDVDDTPLVINSSLTENDVVMCIIELDIVYPEIAALEDDYFTQRFNEVRTRPKTVPNYSKSSGGIIYPSNYPGGEQKPSSSGKGLEGRGSGVLLQTLLPNLGEKQKERATRLLGVRIPISIEATKSQVLMFVSLLLTAELASPNTQIGFTVKRLKNCIKSYTEDTMTAYMMSIQKNWTPTFLKGAVRRVLQLGMIEGAVSYLSMQLQKDVVETLVDSLLYGTIKYISLMDYLDSEYRADLIQELLDRFNIDF